MSQTSAPDSDPSPASDGSSTPGGVSFFRRYRWWILGAAVVVVLVIVALVAASLTRTGSVTPTPTGSASSSATSTPSATPSSTASPTPSATASAAPSTEPQPEASVPLAQGESAAPAPDLTFTMSAIESVQGEAVGPGEVAGPSVRFTIVVRNTTGATVDLTTTAVNAYYGSSETPASQLSGPGGQAFSNTVANGAETTGAFIFSVPADQRGNVKLTVDYTVDTPVLVFQGAAPQ